MAPTLLIGRRKLLAVLAGVAAVAADKGAASWRPEPGIITTACQEDTRMADRIRVAYATRTGSTAELAFFEGMIDPARLSFLDHLAVRLAKSPVGDRRDWERIAGWAVGLAPRLASGSA